jgi:hypothetical protein
MPDNDTDINLSGLAMAAHSVDTEGGSQPRAWNGMLNIQQADPRRHNNGRFQA